MTDRPEKVKALPLLIGPANCQAALGDNWRHAKAFAAAHGVRILRIGKKDFFRADEYLAALERHSATDADGDDTAPHALPTIAPADPAAAVRAALGLRLKAGGE
jgi:hypothetical protein